MTDTTERTLQNGCYGTDTTEWIATMEQILWNGGQLRNRPVQWRICQPDTWFQKMILSL
jgi:hypothetical protein